MPLRTFRPSPFAFNSGAPELKRDSVVCVEDAEVSIEDAVVCVEDAAVRVEDAAVCVEDADFCVENSVVCVEDAGGKIISLAAACSGRLAASVVFESSGAAPCTESSPAVGADNFTEVLSTRG